MGCHDNQAFSHSPHLNFLRTTLFHIKGIPINNLAHMKNCPRGRGARESKLDVRVQGIRTSITKKKTYNFMILRGGLGTPVPPSQDPRI